MDRTLALVAAALALVACTPDFDPASKVDDLRVLAIQAEPPEIAPPEDPDAVHTAALTSLVLRADLDAEPVHTTTVVHVACIPTPGDPKPSPCVELEALRDTTALVAGGAQAACGGGGTRVGFAGVEQCVAATCGAATAGGSPLAAAQVALDPTYTFSTATAAERILGVQAVVLSFAIDASPDELLAAGLGTTGCAGGDVGVGVAALWSSREHVLATKRIVIRGPDAPDEDEPNVNPDVPGIEANGVELDPVAATTVAGGTVSLTPFFPVAPSPQVYWKLDADGLPIERTTEEWVYSWFSTAGELEDLHTRGAEANRWTVSGSAAGAHAVVATVVRDLRGGVAWSVRDVRVVAR